MGVNAVFTPSLEPSQGPTTKEVNTMMWWSDGNGWGWIVMSLSMAIFWGGLILVVVWGVRQFTPGSGRGRPDPTTILEERFARGEISKEELEEGRRVLSKGS